MGLAEGAALIEEAIAFCTRPEYVYSHPWQVGDVLLWDERQRGKTLLRDNGAIPT